MRTLIKSIFIFCFIATLAVSAIAKESKIKSQKDGTYQQSLDIGWGYKVDKKTQLCFFYGSGAGLALVDCKSLAKRLDWKPIITWVK